MCATPLAYVRYSDIFHSGALSGKVIMKSRFRTLIVSAALIGVSMLASSCTTHPATNRPDFQYQPRTSINPACAHGFRPTNALSCSY